MHGGDLRSLLLRCRVLLRGTVADVALIGAIAVLVATVHVFVPPAVRARLVVAYQQPHPLTLFTAAFIHHSTAHLLENLAGYLVAAGVTYVLCRLTDRRGWFRVTVVVLVTVLPGLVNLTSYAVLTAIDAGVVTGRGFSGVAAGFVGFLFAALVVLIAQEYSWSIAYSAAATVVLVLLLEGVLIYSGITRPDMLVLIAVGFALNVVTFAREASVPESRADRVAVLVDVVFVVLLVALLALFMLVLFPPTLGTEGPRTNIIGHGAGFVIGSALSIASYAGLRRWELPSRIRHPTN